MEEVELEAIKRRSVNGVLALISRSFVLNLVSFGASLIIFTILSAREVGIYTAVIAIQRVISFFTDFGLGAALVQKKDELVGEDLTTSFTIQASATFLIFVSVFFLRGFIVSFFRLSAEGERLLVVLVFCIFLSSFKTIPSILLERKIHFQRLIIPQIFESLTFNLLLIILVLRGFKIDSFSVAFLASSLVGIPIYYFVSPWRVKLGIYRDSIRHLKYGVTFQIKNVLATVKDDLLTVFLAKILTFTEIGYIGFAQKLAFFMYRYIVDSVTKVTFSTYSRIQENTALLRKAIEKSLFFVSIPMFPIIFGIIITMPYIVLYFPRWHNKWEPALISIVFFSLNALVSSFSGILVNLLDSTGRVNITLKLMVFWTALTWIFTPLLIYFYGYNGVSAASFLVTLTIVFTIILARRVVDFSFFKSIYKPFFASLIMALVVYSGEKLLVKDLITLIIDIIAGGIIYVIIFYVLAKEELNKDLKKIFSKT